MSLISGLAVGKSRRLSGLRREGRGSTPRTLWIEGRTVLVGDEGAVLRAIDGGELGGERGGVGDEMARCREKLRMLLAAEDLENERGEMVVAIDVMLLLRPVVDRGGVRGALLPLQILLLRKLLRPEELEPPEDELVSVPLLLIFLSLLNAPRLLRGGLVADAQTVMGSRHI